MTTRPSDLPAQPEISGEPDLSLAGRDLGDFTLLCRLGRGAMAEVYLAEQRSLKRQVAVKVLKPQLARDAAYVRRFHHEAQAAASLVHANIVQIHDVGCVDGLHFIAQEYVPGQNLQQFMSRQGLPSLALTLAILRQVAGALGKAAEQGIVHRDIKPDNIMLSPAGDVKVADFGLARVMNGGASVTKVGVTVGTPLYMSPEQAEGKPLDPRSDLYSLGVTAYHMLAGRPPFEGEEALGVALQHLQAQPERLERLRPDLPPALCRIVHTLLQKQPEQRYPSARDLLRDLRTLSPSEGDDAWPDNLDVDGPSVSAADLGARSAATQHLQAAMQRQPPPARHRWKYALWALGAAAAMAVGAAIEVARRPPFVLENLGGSRASKQATAEAQLDVAQALASEDWLLSVEHYFPEATAEVREARRDLARSYLEQERWSDALAVLARLNAGPEPANQAFALAGRSFVFARQQDPDQAAQALEQLFEILNDGAPLEPEMRQLAGRAVEYVRGAKNQDHDQAWQKLLDSLETEDDDDGE